MAMGAFRLLLATLIVFSFLVGLSLSDSQEVALLAFKDSLDDSTAFASWVPGTSPCSGWIGIYCFDGVLTGVHLQNMALSGQINIDALRNLNGLRSLNLANNFFSGPFPAFNRLGGMNTLVVSQNQFSGEVPGDYFASMGSLKKLWLSGNILSGEMPESLGLLTGLLELHIEGNQFSGEIPQIDSQKITSLDLSYNRLVGEIPSTLSRFDPSSFKGNLGLCGKPLKPCAINETMATPEQSPPPQKPSSTSNEMLGIWTIAILVVIVILLIVIVFAIKKRKDEDCRAMGKDGLSEGTDGLTPTLKPKSSRISSLTKRLSIGRKDSFGNLVIVNDEKGTFGLTDLMKASAEVLGNGNLGSSYKAVMSNGLSVIVKRLREMTILGKEDFDIAITRLGTLRHPNILTPLAYHYRKEEKLLVSQFMPKGNLSYVLHGDRGASHNKLNWPTRMKIVRGIARGLGFLHLEFSTYDLPHGNLKSSNVLLNDSYEALLNDYALHPLIDTPQAPQVLQAYKAPESSYRLSQKCDVYCLGVVILEIVTGKFPSQYLPNGKGGTNIVEWVQSSISQQLEVEVIDPAMSDDLKGSKHQMLKLLHIGSTCAESDPDRRPTVTEAIRKIEEL
ncbi:hypothetical protein MLD38_006959 [Melastoma candidum]|uniref:Uncharacterized protein n=1 Tax=Melastoma candidum TaxID=119954 RepID=A0ACB9RQX0_9MYRT|nr:hypothetical protein MLD38_006959 [Melastoma candidum]